VPNLQIKAAATQVGVILDWLMVHRSQHSVLLRRLGENVPDPTDRAMWLGERQPLDVSYWDQETNVAAP
jgi:aromatic ring-cleaving dioxygenase